MKILIYSGTFYPNVGGMETFILVLARQFQLAGNEVTLVTLTASGQEQDCKLFPFSVVRIPSFFRLFNLIKKCDIFFHNGLSLKALWPIMLFRKKLVVTHHTWYRRNAQGEKGWQDYIKLFVSRYVVNVSVSNAVFKHLLHASQSFIVPNPYDSTTFAVKKEIYRNKDLVFLGRLVSDKGVNVLLAALAVLKNKGLEPTLSIIGDGPEKESLIALAMELNVYDQICFLGLKKGEELVAALNQHHILVVPSIWAEPFGIVALEGIACGCVVVGSEQGGLKDAIGPCGLTFPNGDVEKLAASLMMLLMDKSLLEKFKINSAAHLKKHSEVFVANSYLSIFQKILSS